MVLEETAEFNFFSCEASQPVLDLFYKRNRRLHVLLNFVVNPLLVGQKFEVGKVLSKVREIVFFDVSHYCVTFFFHLSH